ncbi:hypothetical protein Hanom_Chr06g00510691 [Helianthus anomalus]
MTEIKWGRPNDGSFPTEAWFGLEGNPVLPSCYPSESIVWGQYGFWAEVSLRGGRGPIEHRVLKSGVDGRLSLTSSR